MTLWEEYKKFINSQNTLLRSSGMSKKLGEKEYILARMVKIGEEFGELCDEVLASIGHQRSGKMNGRSKESLGDECADVIITTFLLAETMHVDMSEALARKIQKIQKKHNRQIK